MKSIVQVQVLINQLQHHANINTLYLLYPGVEHKRSFMY